MENARPDPMPATPQQQAILSAYAARIDAATHGAKGGLFDALAAELGVSLRSAHRWLDEHLVRDRKRRSDAGTLALTRQEAATVSATLMEGFRAHGKQIGKLTDVVAWLRTGGHIRAERVEPGTGEIIPLSDSSIARALRAYHLHPEQLRQPTPHVRLSTPHPNHTWQVDASVCVVFYLPGGGVHITELRDGVHYKNKPENLKAIEAFRVIRYVVADHNSGVLRWHYYPHAESGQHTVRFLAWAMAPKASSTDPFNGAPLFLMVDPGATAAGLVKLFCRRMEIELIVNKPGNARAKGSVEKGQDIVECKFEAGLKFVREEVRTFDDLNRLADLYQAHFNATAKHSRHGKTRYSKWMEIQPNQLRITPAENVLLSLATEQPVRRKIRGDMTAEFKSRQWNVIDVPGATRGGHVQVHWHPFLTETAMAVVEDADGREVHIPLPEVTTNEHGFPSTAVEIGTGFRATRDTVLETHRKEVEKLASGKDRLGEAESVRKGRGYTPFGGTMDPYKEARETTPPTWLPRAGTALDVDVPEVQAKKLSATEAALRLQAELGDDWHPDYFAWLSQRFPDGLGEDQLERLAAQWSGGDNHKEAQAC